MRNKFLTISVLKFLYHCARRNKKPKPITYGGRMSEEKYLEAMEIVEVEKQKLKQLNIQI